MYYLQWNLYRKSRRRATARAREQENKSTTDGDTHIKVRVENTQQTAAIKVFSVFGSIVCTACISFIYSFHLFVFVPPPLRKVLLKQRQRMRATWNVKYMEYMARLPLLIVVSKQNRKIAER